MMHSQLLKNYASVLIESSKNGELTPEQLVAQSQDIGRVLSQTKWKHLVENIDDEYVRNYTAIMLENQDIHFNETPGYRQQKMLNELSRKVGKLTEDTTTADIATIDQVTFPIIRSVVPNYVAADLVSVQPMLGPQSVVSYFRMTYGTDKGQVQAGTDPTQFPDEWYGSEVIDREVLAEGTGLDASDANRTYASKAAFAPVRPNTLLVSWTAGDDTARSVRDDGDGKITGTGVENDSATVNYTDGSISIEFTTGTTYIPKDNTNILISYEYSSEANDDIPSIDAEVITSPVTAREHKMRTRWSINSAQQLSSVFGLNAEAEFGNFVTGELKSQTDRRVIYEIDRIASAKSTEFGRIPDEGTAYIDHKQQFLDILTEAGYNIFQATKRARGNWLLMGTKVATIVETLPGFVSSGITGQHGVIDIGTLGRWRCFTDPYRSNQAGYTVGHKSGNISETGMIFAPYIVLYMTPTVTLDDFLSRKGFSTQFALKAVDGNYFSKGEVKEEEEFDQS